MKKAVKKPQHSDDMALECRFDYKKAKPNRFAKDKPMETLMAIRRKLGKGKLNDKDSAEILSEMRR